MQYRYRGCLGSAGWWSMVLLSGFGVWVLVDASKRRGQTQNSIPSVQCSFTKWAEVFAVSNQHATTCGKVLVRNWIGRFGVPDSIHSDNGRNFESKIFSEMRQLLSVNKTRTSACHPEGNGQVENLHKTLRGMLKARVEDSPATLDEHRDLCMMAYHSSVHSSSGNS